jgi:hypothetical protein
VRWVTRARARVRVQGRRGGRRWVCLKGVRLAGSAKSAAAAGGGSASAQRQLLPRIPPLARLLGPAASTGELRGWDPAAVASALVPTAVAAAVAGGSGEVEQEVVETAATLALVSVTSASQRAKWRWGRHGGLT